MRLRRNLVLVLAAGALLLAWGVSPSLSSASTSKRFPRSSVGAQSHRQRRSESDSGYWSRRRIKRARPAVASRDGESSSTTRQMDSEGAPQWVTGVPMRGRTPALKHPRIFRGSGSPTYSFPPPTSYSDQPTIDEGKLFFDAGGVPYQCSATVVTSP